jgi:hypothetical protein
MVTVAGTFDPVLRCVTRAYSSVTRRRASRFRLCGPILGLIALTAVCAEGASCSSQHGGCHAFNISVLSSYPELTPISRTFQLRLHHSQDLCRTLRAGSDKRARCANGGTAVRETPHHHCPRPRGSDRHPRGGRARGGRARGGRARRHRHGDGRCLPACLDGGQVRPARIYLGAGGSEFVHTWSWSHWLATSAYSRAPFGSIIRPRLRTWALQLPPGGCHAVCPERRTRAWPTFPG